MSQMQDFKLLLARRTAWLPIDLGAALLGYYDAENGASVPQTPGAVTTWTDPITNYQPTQATAGKRPVWSATSLNNRPAITFDSIDDELGASNHPYPSGTTAMEMWALVSQDVAPADTTLRFLCAYGGANVLGTYRSVNAGVNRAGGSRSSGANDASVNYSGVHVTRLRLTATTVFISVDGGAETSGASSLSADVTPFTIGSWSSANYWGGKINWIGITAPLSAGNATSLLAYLKARGGVP